MAFEEHPMWTPPQHHLDLSSPSDHVHWIELFYDLIHVVIIFMLGNYLSVNLSVEGFFVFCGLFIAIWYAWADSSVFNSLYVSTDFQHRFIMAAQIITAMFMAASIPHVHYDGWVFFAIAFSLNRFITAYMYFRTAYLGIDGSHLPIMMSRNFSLLGIVFLISAFIPAPYSYLLFGSGIISIQVLYMAPKVGALECPRFVPRLSHMSERFALLLLIVVGEGFFKLVVSLSEKAIYQVSPDVLVNYAFGGISIFILCWVYFDFVGNGKLKNTSKSNRVNWWLSHLFLMLAAVMVGVALSGTVKVGFWNSYPGDYAAVGSIGLAMYLFCIWRIQKSIMEREAHEFATGSIRWFGILLALATFFAVPYIPAIVGKLMWGFALVIQIFIPLSRGYLKIAKQ